MLDSGSSFNISKSSLITIVEKIISETDGAELYRVEDNLIDKLIPRRSKKGVRIEFTNGVIEVFISVLMKKGMDIPFVCETMQNSIKKAVQEMTNAVVNKINIRLVDCIA